jgi:hypothetical protein
VKRLGAYFIVAVVTATLTVAIQVVSGDAAGHPSAAIHIPLGGAVIFDGLGWSCYSHPSSPDPVGVLSGPSKSRPQVFCRYLIDDGGCPFVAMANPYLWLGDSQPLVVRKTSTGAGYIRTHFGCD